MQKVITISLLLAMSLSIMSFSGNSISKQNSIVEYDSNLDQYIGEYEEEMTGGIIEIFTRKNGTKLFFTFPGEGAIELIPAGKHRFSFVGDEETAIQFKKEKGGVFRELVLIQPEDSFRAIRVEIEDLAGIEKKLMQRGFSGVVLIEQGDSIIFNKAYGRKNSKDNGMNDVNTVFDICSITKQFTGAGILKLAMQNKLTLEDQLTKYFDDVPDDKKAINIHHLLTHSSGLTAGIGADYETITEAAFLDKVFKSELVSPVGEAYSYSNMGYSLLGLIIEKASGMDYETFLNKELFTPSNMHHTGYVIPDWQADEVANGYVNDTEAKQPNEENWNDKGPYLNLKGNGGILTRASDLLLWSKAIRDHAVLNEEWTAKYLSPQITLGEGTSGYGYGWGIKNNDSEDKLVRHAGASDLFTSDVWIYPKKGITVIVLSNRFDMFVLSIGKRISNFLLGG